MFDPPQNRSVLGDLRVRQQLRELYLLKHRTCLPLHKVCWASAFPVPCLGMTNQPSPSALHQASLGHCSQTLHSSTSFHVRSPAPQLLTTRSVSPAGAPTSIPGKAEESICHLGACTDKPCSAEHSGSRHAEIGNMSNTTQGVNNQQVFECLPDKQHPQFLWLPPCGESQIHTTFSSRGVPYQQRQWDSMHQKRTIPPSCRNHDTVQQD